MRILFVCVLLLFTSCHPLSRFSPRAITTKTLRAQSQNKIDVAIDNYGIPFIKAQNLHDAAYALGFMHARDRLFQLDLIRHAALGKTAELFGERGLSFDKKARILTYRLDEQLSTLSDREKQLLESYIRGVNDSAKQRGRSAEHFLLGAQFDEFTMRDVIAIARLQSWQLGADLLAEVTRLKIARSQWSLDAKKELIAAMDDQQSAVITHEKLSSQQQPWVMPEYLNRRLSPTNIKNDNNIDEDFVQTSGGASNAWAIDARNSKDGHAMLMNDPHLQHNWPSNFYLATIEADDVFVTGATFVGLPGILIGASKNLAWGVTASCLNTQDAVLLSVDKNDPTHYVVDGKKLAFTKWPQTYCTDKKGSCKQDVNYVSIYGPVITNKFDRWIDKGDALAVQWTGFVVEEHKDISIGFIDLSRAQDVHQGIDAIKKMTLPGVNLILADVKGNVGYSYAGLVPERDSTQNLYLPLDGQKFSSRWQKFLNDKPSVVNPQNGFIVTANQNIFQKGSDENLAFGKQGAPPFRAMRIKQRLEDMLKEDKIDFEKAASIQLDDTSLEAQHLSPLLGAVCKEYFKDASNAKRTFANAIAAFDGKYTVDSLGALPYEMLVKEAIAGRLKDALGDNLPEGMMLISQTNYVVKAALERELKGEKTALFDSSSSAFNIVSQACDRAYDNLVKKVGSSSFKWRWGRHHYLQRQSVLAKAPIIGGWFRDKKREVAGVASAPMAEIGTPVLYGANLRFKAQMKTPIEIHAVIDSGNSGTVGHKNAFDQVDLWHQGKSIRIETEWKNALKNSVTHFAL